MAITIIGNVGNVGYALPMVSAYPTDVNLSYLLGWNPTAQALDYVAYTGNAFGDFGVTRDLAVTRNLTVGGNSVLGDAADTVTIAGILSAGPTVPLGAVIPFLTGGMVATATLEGLTVKAVSGGNNAELLNNQLNVQATKVVGARQVGWVAMTGAASRATKAVGTVTLPELAAIVMALQADMITHGLIGT
jgi:hypothetical protein